MKNRRKSRILLVLGVLVFILPLLGFPGVIKTILLYVLGIGVSAIAITDITSTKKRGDNLTQETPSFVDNAVSIEEVEKTIADEDGSK